MKIEPAKETPKAELFHAFRLNGHIPVQRNSRSGYIPVLCSLKKRLQRNEAEVVVYGGVWWCTVRWCMVVYGSNFVAI
jgi:hypothetical protein